MIETILSTNTIVKRLIASGVVSLHQLKKIFRTCSKMTHPDIVKRDGSEFIRLKAEYEEALSHWDELSARLGGGLSGLLGKSDIRRMFYASLRHYLAAGLYSPRMRIRPDIKKRNELILREVILWAKQYDPSFVQLFLEYNKTHLRRYVEWNKRDPFSKAGRLFLQGLRNTVKYEADRSMRALRSARSYFTDCRDVLRLVDATNPGAAAVIGLESWFTAELDALERIPGPGKETA